MNQIIVNLGESFVQNIFTPLTKFKKGATKIPTSFGYYSYNFKISFSFSLTLNFYFIFYYILLTIYYTVIKTVSFYACIKLTKQSFKYYVLFVSTNFKLSKFWMHYLSSGYQYGIYQISSAGQNEQRAVKSVSATAISGLWLSSLYIFGFNLCNS